MNPSYAEWEQAVVPPAAAEELALRDREMEVPQEHLLHWDCGPRFYSS